MRRILLLLAFGTVLGSTTLWAGTPQETQRFEAAVTAGDAALSSGQWTLAMERYREALTLQPHHAEARFHLAMAYREAARYYEARRNFRLALTARPKDAAWESQCRLQIAACWEATHHYREALAEYRLALAADSGSDLAKEGQRRTVAQVHGGPEGSK